MQSHAVSMCRRRHSIPPLSTALRARLTPLLRCFCVLRRMLDRVGWTSTSCNRESDMRCRCEDNTCTQRMREKTPRLHLSQPLCSLVPVRFSRSSDAPFIRHAAIDAAQLRSLLAAHDATDSASSLPSSQATAAPAASPADSGEGSSNLASSLRCLNFSRYEAETEWNASVAAEERVYNQILQQSSAANPSAPAAARSKFSDNMVHNRLLNWCLALKPQPGLQAEHAKLRASFEADRAAKSAAPATAATRPLHFVPYAPFAAAGAASAASSPLPATPARAQASTGLGVPTSSSKASFSPGGAELANALLNLGPNANAPLTPAASGGSATAAVSPSSTIASRALLGIGAAATSSPAKSKRGAGAAGAMQHPPEKKARGAETTTTSRSPPKPRASRNSKVNDAASAAASQSGSILQLAALAEQQAV